MGTNEACALGLVNETFMHNVEDFVAAVKRRAVSMVTAPSYASCLKEKVTIRAADERSKPLISYREEELDKMKLNFYGFDPSYHIARYNFVHKVPKSRTPLTIARHRRAAN